MNDFISKYNFEFPLCIIENLPLLNQLKMFKLKKRLKQ